MARGGYINTAITFYNVHGKKTWLKNINSKLGLILKGSANFLNETMETEQKYKPTEDTNKEHSEVHAIKEKRKGRGSGGLEMLTSKGVNAREISKSKNHISVAFANIYLVGVYYPPLTDVDDIVMDLAIALKKIPAGTSAVVG